MVGERHHASANKAVHVTRDGERRASTGETGCKQCPSEQRSRRAKVPRSVSHLAPLAVRSSLILASSLILSDPLSHSPPLILFPLSSLAPVVAIAGRGEAIASVVKTVRDTCNA